MQKGISTLAGIMIFAAEILILFGGVFIFQHIAMQKFQQIQIYVTIHF